MTADISTAIAQRLAAQSGDAVFQHGEWKDWRWMALVAAQLDAAIAPLKLPPGAPAALVTRNRPQHAAAIAAQLAAGRPTTMIYSAQSPAAMANDVSALRPAVLIADADDWTPDLAEAAESIGALAIAISPDAAAPVRVRAPARLADSYRQLDADVAFELLTSGTTGLPKRLPLSWRSLDAIVSDARAAYAAPQVADARQPPGIVVHPLGNVAGVNYVAAPLAFGQPLVLMEKFELGAWVQAVREHKPSRTALPPSAVRMVLERNTPPEDLASLRVIGTGGGALDPALQARFEEKYGVAILPAFGATEFGGVIANWTLDLHKAFAATKRGSAGRARPGVELRILDRETFAPLPAGEIGLLSARTPVTGDAWVRTNDLASLDADGFLFLHGRADNAINRGGFKVVPDVVADALRAHPAVIDAAVVGIPDARLGETPVAAVEVNAPVSAEELTAFARTRLLAYQVPTQVRIVDALPRNASMKVTLPEVRALFGTAPASP